MRIDGKEISVTPLLGILAHTMEAVIDMTALATTFCLRLMKFIFRATKFPADTAICSNHSSSSLPPHRRSLPLGAGRVPGFLDIQRTGCRLFFHACSAGPEEEKVHLKVLEQP